MKMKKMALIIYDEMTMIMAIILADPY